MDSVALDVRGLMMKYRKVDILVCIGGCAEEMPQNTGFDRPQTYTINTTSNGIVSTHNPSVNCLYWEVVLT